MSLDHNELHDALAPCGLDCGRCLANPHSRISVLSRELLRELGGFSSLAPRFADMDPVFEGYEHCNRILTRFASGSCSGCRKGGCLLSSCRINECTTAKQVDYCFQCNDFPCVRTGLPSGLLERWENNNRRMQAIGPEAFLAEIRTRPRY